jgi:hypothetical protein
VVAENGLRVQILEKAQHAERVGALGHEVADRVEHVSALGIERYGIEHPLERLEASLDVTHEDPSHVGRWSPRARSASRAEGALCCREGL